MKITYTLIILNLLALITNAQFTPNNIVVLQTKGTANRAPSQAVLKEFTTNGTVGITVAIDSSSRAVHPFLTSGQYAAPGTETIGSEGFLTTSVDGKFIVLSGYGTFTTVPDITATTSSSVHRVVGKIDVSGTYTEMYSSSTFFNTEEIRAAISDGINFWASGDSKVNADGIDFFGPGRQAALATSFTPPNATALHIFNNQIYYSTEKAGPTNTCTHLGIFVLSNGKPTGGTVTVCQVIDIGENANAEDFSFSNDGKTCYIAIASNSLSGGIQKWTNKTGWASKGWALAYKLATGISNIGAYGLVVDYSGVNPVLYATTFEPQTTGNRVIKISDTGMGSTATTLVGSVAGVTHKGITFTPCSAPISVSVSGTNPVCTGDNLILSSSALGATSYIWNGPNSFNSFSQNASISDVTAEAKGTYTVTASNACGSATATISINIKGSSTSSQSTTACNNYIWNGITCSAGGDQTYSTINAAGCDSIAILHLTIKASTTSGESATACNTYLWNGIIYTSSGDETYSTTNVAGCDSIVTLHLTINNSSSSDQSVTACNSYVWNDKTYTSSGDQTYSTINAAGCDSTSALHLTINHSSTSEQSATACNSYAWNSTTYSTSGDKTFSTTNPSGCDSTAILHLTINGTSTGEESITACMSFLWNDSTYTSSGDRTHLFAGGNAMGCDSVAILHLTINSDSMLTPAISGDLYYCAGGSTTLSTSVFASYLWSPDGQTTQMIEVTSAGTYTVAVTNAKGCSGSVSASVLEDSLPAPVISGNLSFCAGGSTTLSTDNYVSYLWSPGGQTTQTININTPGSYAVIGTDLNGCFDTSSSSAATIYTIPSDINVDGVVDIRDFVLFVGQFDTTCDGCREDINGDGIVDIYDYLIFIVNYGETCQ